MSCGIRAYAGDVRTPAMNRAADVSLQLHRAAVQHLLKDWAAAEPVIRANLERLRSRRRAPLAETWVAEWVAAVEAGPEAVARVALTPGGRGEDLRQVSPLAGVLPEEERLQVLREVADSRSQLRGRN